MKAPKRVKHLVVGNHDSQWMKKVDLERYFESVELMKEVSDAGSFVKSNISSFKTPFLPTWGFAFFSVVLPKRYALA